jgi:RNA recognition motif-containing protein
MSIYVGNLSYDVTEAHLTSAFADFGAVKRVYLPTDRETGRMRGFGFVEMNTDAEENAAIEALDGAEWMLRSNGPCCPDRNATSGASKGIWSMSLRRHLQM